MYVFKKNILPLLQGVQKERANQTKTISDGFRYVQAFHLKANLYPPPPAVLLLKIYLGNCQNFLLQMPL